MVGDNGVILISRYRISEVESFFIDLETGVYETDRWQYE